MASRHRRSLHVSVLATALMCLLASCGGSGASGGSDKAGGASPAGYPKKIGNCGREVTVKRPPSQAVSLDQDSTEILLSLGLGDRIAGTATWTDPVLPELAAANRKIPRLAENNPSFERVLDKEPDFVSATFQATLGKDGVAGRGDFEKLGVPTYVSPSDCEDKDTSGGGDGARTKPLELGSVYGEIRDLAKVFGVEERGEKLIAKLEKRRKRATEGVDARHARVMYWFANSESPYMAGCCGAPGIITRAVGAKNVFDDTKQEWPQINWEQVADRDPDMIVLGDLTRKRETAETAKQKIKKLESNPVTRKMTAVKKKRYVFLSGAAMNPSIRVPGEGIEKVAAGLRKYGLDH
ncbi:ABC transporter substrate-binding protein [Streptomyces sp. ODS28]|uniref:ABC transporter substrate-binding protein n=1 Tax=Streptomyces sp. ODS28 TaxID=3136688 RepID=UPI0031E63C58